MSVTTPGTPTLVSYVDYDDTPSLTWTASSVSGGDVIQYYELNYVSSKSGLPVWTRGRYTEVEVATNSHTMAVADGLYAHWRVRTAYKVGGVGTTVFTSYSSTLTKYILFRGDNDWTNFTNIASNITTTFEYEDFPTATSKTAGLHKKVVQNTTASTTYTAAQNYIYRDFGGLTVGRTYYCTANAILGTASIQGNLYRLQVNTSTPTVGPGATLTTTESVVPTLTFVATSTTHRIRFELNETFTQTTTGTKEDFALRDFSLYEILNAPYDLQPHQQEMSVAQAFDLATQSVGGYWWVDRNNETNFAQFPLSEVSSFTFTDDAGVAGDLHYIDIEAGYDSRDIVNSVTVNNFGRVPQYDDDLKFDPYVINYLSPADTASVDEWGARAISLDTNIYTPLVTNYVTNPSIEANLDNIQNNDTAFLRLRRRKASKWVVSGGDIDNTGTRLLAIVNTGSGGNLDPIFNGSDTSTEILVNEGQVYTAVAHVARAQSTADAQARVDLRWYDSKGDLISTVTGASTTLGLLTWRKVTASGTAPVGANTAEVRVVVSRSGGGSFSTGDIHLIDSVALLDGVITDYFDGSFQSTTSFIYEWTGAEQQSSTRRYTNNLYGRANDITTKFAAPEFTVKALTWNAAEDFDNAYLLDIGQNVTVNFKGTTGLYRITGIEHDMTPGSWIVKLKLGKV